MSHHHDDEDREGVSRRHALECMLWAGTGCLGGFRGVPKSLGLLSPPPQRRPPRQVPTFLQISDSHIRFDKAANPHAIDTLKEAIGRVKALPAKPAFRVANLKAGGLGYLGSDQLEWLEDDLKPLSASTPIVVFAHIPLWSIYPTWGWGTDDSAQALTYLKRFGSVTVLNGHIHQLLQKVEGNVTFHTARSTAFPQPAPGTAPSPGPMVVPAEKLRSVLGITTVTFKQGKSALAITDTALADA